MKENRSRPVTPAGRSHRQRQHGVVVRRHQRRDENHTAPQWKVIISLAASYSVCAVWGVQSRSLCMSCLYKEKQTESWGTSRYKSETLPVRALLCSHTGWTCGWESYHSFVFHLLPVGCHDSKFSGGFFWGIQWEKSRPRKTFIYSERST